MNWNITKDIKPTIYDLPFLTYSGYIYEVWEDMDYFYELENEDREKKLYLCKIDQPNVISIYLDKEN